MSRIDLGPRNIRSMPMGAERSSDGSAHFQVWAPERTRIELMLDERRIAMDRDSDGYWNVPVPDVKVGALYQFLVDGTSKVHPDPASRFQPHGPEGPSQVVDPHAYAWTDAAWSGVHLPGQVLYELHVGTFSEAGTWEGALGKLAHLREIGVTLIELMPVAEFPGAFGWGYDGVLLFAPHHGYGSPDSFRAFVDAAHGMGIGVILDVVYNHVGPAGNHLPEFSRHYFSERETDWGAGLNFDGHHARPVRDFVVHNASYWIREFHLDGLRLDATQSIFDTSHDHILAELARSARAAAGGRSIVLIAENEPQESRLIRPPSDGGYGLDAIWNDDFHHSATVALLGRREAYYTDYRGHAAEFVAAIRRGPLYQGQYYSWQKQRRGTPAEGVPRSAFVAFLENHDQIANSARGTRTAQLSRPGSHRAMTALLLLGPWTPMLFQGQEWGATVPFIYFADHTPDLADKVRNGRREFVAQFPSLASRAVQEQLPDPGAQAWFEASKLDWSGSRTNARGQQSLALHRDLLHLRRTDAVFRAAALGDADVDAAVLDTACFAMRCATADETRLVIVNLAADLPFRPAPEPLLAPPYECRWRLQWTSDEPRYGGTGTPEALNDDAGWDIPGPVALVFEPEKR